MRLNQNKKGFGSVEFQIWIVRTLSQNVQDILKIINQFHNVFILIFYSHSSLLLDLNTF